MAAVLAHGGLGAMDGVFAVFVFLAAFGAVGLAWLIASLWLLARPAEKRLGRIGAWVYGSVSALLCAAGLFASVAGSGFLVAPLILVFFAVALGVPLVAAKVFARRRQAGGGPAAG